MIAWLSEMIIQSQFNKVLRISIVLTEKVSRSFSLEGKQQIKETLKMKIIYF